MNTIIDFFLRYKPLWIGCFVLVTAYVYSPIVQMGFCQADDLWMLLTNKYVNPSQFSGNYFRAVFTRVNDIQYSPVNTLYYAVVYKLNRLDPYYFHFCNYILHLLNFYLVYLVSCRLLNIFAIPNSRTIAILTAVFWCVHPINVEPVVWVSGSKILLCTLFTLLAFFYFLDGYKKQKGYLFGLSMFFYIVSMFVKEQGMMTPFMCIFVLIMLRFRDPQLKRLLLRPLAYHIAGLLISTGFALFTIFHVNEIESINFKPISAYPPMHWVVLCFYCLRFYVINLMFPVNLHYHYPFPIGPTDTIPVMYYVFPALFVLFFILFIIYTWKSRNAPFIYTCIGILVAITMPPSGGRMTITEFIDRRFAKEEVKLFYINRQEENPYEPYSFLNQAFYRNTRVHAIPMDGLNYSIPMNAAGDTTILLVVRGNLAQKVDEVKGMRLLKTGYPSIPARIAEFYFGRLVRAEEYFLYGREDAPQMLPASLNRLPRKEQTGNKLPTPIAGVLLDISR